MDVGAIQGRSTEVEGVRWRLPLRIGRRTVQARYRSWTVGCSSRVCSLLPVEGTKRPAVQAADGRVDSFAAGGALVQKTMVVDRHLRYLEAFDD